ncbi:PREDICTED: tetratricopeptide repeat protein 39B-like isoform X1 [Papilio xuthus]|uniref:Tetratricopeptide repeat protein 39B-like isoform X1 n=1 Tax=Papilio xuthus TaxID=66420 RepID=A0AAJ6ZUH9_PAPXU|nr:PREDICTED: tetratricopeptide repeat protein 39B-like isoform X1 [Papilio xuthus]XP_013179278.1 PREDICTED: tetratricopeptide repeat protein 39B-like isoform X1 [Papilio xuthus]XP_013179279.1 PREDICTED: tetratricopeptide repeat protein 39B-like isoform X1 [Papilio xuthus]XP_013179280.1 PREDICTED: tetratricopeptide repeat protein 39B-like isoform X1 [Papilio xuthus]XP_013179281.1 PREDICTED: tetratricopeptide repeat protein 39B-like isoform X1 [Papilio xuthus]XP_013179282.1 PREDICTED: tetratric
MAEEEDPGPLNSLPRDLRGPLEMDDSDEEPDNFQDAAEEASDENTNLQMALADCEMAIKRFFNNDMETAMEIMKSRSSSSIYHSLGVSIFEFIPAVLTLDSAQVGRAIQSLKTTVHLCNQHRRSYTIMQTIGTMIVKTNYATMTDLEAHAELCFAESMLLQAALCVIEGEDIAAFLRAAMKIKNSYNTYKECSRILEKKAWESVESRQHFHSGVRLGLATFNIMIALLPARIITLLEYVGYSGDKEAGLAELQAGARQPGLRGVLCEIVSLGIHLVVSHFAGATPNLHQCREIIDAQLKVYPEGVWFLLFEGRLELLRGRCALAAATYRRVAETRHLWPQLRHLCYWELMWASAMMMDWRTAAEFAGRLIEESTWSRTMYCYAKAALLLQLGEECTSAERNHVVDLLKAAPLYRQKIAGKSLPMEKWVIKRCTRYSAQGGRLMMPAMELLCLWNMMSALAADVPTLQSLLKKIDYASEVLERDEKLWPPALMSDNRALIFYLRGCCLSALGMQLLAIQQFENAVALKNMIKTDTFLVPYALYEAATCHYNLGEVNRAVRMWQDARKSYSNYSLESRLQFRLHSKLEMAQNNAQTQAGRSLPTKSLPSVSPKLVRKN